MDWQNSSGLEHCRIGRRQRVQCCIRAIAGGYRNTYLNWENSRWSMRRCT